MTEYDKKISFYMLLFLIHSRRYRFMKAYIINDERLREKEEKVFRSIILIVFII